jgi:hypothetical protein
MVISTYMLLHHFIMSWHEDLVSQRAKTFSLSSDQQFVKKLAELSCPNLLGGGAAASVTIEKTLGRRKSGLAPGFPV